jgi:hypothetical protein
MMEMAAAVGAHGMVRGAAIGFCEIHHRSVQ